MNIFELIYWALILSVLSYVAIIIADKSGMPLFVASLVTVLVAVVLLSAINKIFFFRKKLKLPKPSLSHFNKSDPPQ